MKCIFIYLDCRPFRIRISAECDNLEEENAEGPTGTYLFSIYFLYSIFIFYISFLLSELCMNCVIVLYERIYFLKSAKRTRHSQQRNRIARALPEPSTSRVDGRPKHICKHMWNNVGPNRFHRCTSFLTDAHNNNRVRRDNNDNEEMNVIVYWQISITYQIR